MCNCRGSTVERSRVAQARAAHLVASQRIASLSLARTVAGGGVGAAAGRARVGAGRGITAPRSSVRVSAVPRAGAVRPLRSAVVRATSTVAAPVVTGARVARTSTVRPVRVGIVRAGGAGRVGGMARPRA